MRPLTPSEAADLARVVTHPRFDSMFPPTPVYRVWMIDFRVNDYEDRIERRTLRACIKAAVRWMEEQGT